MTEMLNQDNRPADDLTIFNSGGYWAWSSGVWWVMPEG
jgi:hypothetical protein